jgi:hypothetical protein
MDLETLWQQLPPRLGDDYLNDSKKRLKRLWLKHYKSRLAEETPRTTPIADFEDYTIFRMQFANAISSQTADENRQFESQLQRLRGRHLIPPDEFDIYICEPVIDRQLYNGDPNL